MTRITVAKSLGVLTLKIEGELTHRYVGELQSCWQAAIATHNGDKVEVDLDGVTFVDEAGRNLLASMHSSGVALQATNILTRFVVDEITKP